MIFDQVAAPDAEDQLPRNLGRRAEDLRRRGRVCSLRGLDFPRLKLAAILPLVCLLPLGICADSRDPLADSEVMMRSFKPRDYQGSPVVARVHEHPATGELLLLAGTLLHVYDGVQWIAVQTDTPAVLANSNLEAFRTVVAKVRVESPEAAKTWEALDQAAAGYQLSRLRGLLGEP